MVNVTVIPEENFVDDGDSHIDVLKKVMVLDWACKLGHTGCISYTTEKFENYKEAPSRYYQKLKFSYSNCQNIVQCNGKLEILAWI